MSSYLRDTEHPETKKAERAEWLDDYFGQHNYGVRFPSDGKVFRADEFEWAINHDKEVLEGVHRGGLRTVEITKVGKHIDFGKQDMHEEGKEPERKDVTVSVNRLNLKDPTEEDKVAEKAITERLSKVAVRVVLIHKPSNDFASFEVKLPEVREAAMQVVKSFNKRLEEKLGVKGAEAPLSEFVLVEYESHQVRVTSLI